MGARLDSYAIETAANRTTTDCDVMVYTPAAAMSAVETAADDVAAELGLAANWLNSTVQIRRDTLPDGWESRKVWVGDWGRLRVWSVGRADLIAMKVLAGRAQDLEDLKAMRVRPDEGVRAGLPERARSEGDRASGD